MTSMRATFRPSNQTSISHSSLSHNSCGWSRWSLAMESSGTVAPVEIADHDQGSRRLCPGAQNIAQKLSLARVGRVGTGKRSARSLAAVQMDRRDRHRPRSGHIERHQKHALCGKTIEPGTVAFGERHPLNRKHRIVRKHRQAAVEHRRLVFAEIPASADRIAGTGPGVGSLGPATHTRRRYRSPWPAR